MTKKYNDYIIPDGPTVPSKNYGKIYRSGRRVKTNPPKKGNKIKFEIGTHVTVHGRHGKIIDKYEYLNVFYYRLEWREPRLSWYDKHIGQEPSKFGWAQSRFIRRTDVID